MNVGYCVCCGEPLSAEGTMICWSCEQKETKLGLILQSQNATKEEVKKAYSDLEEELKKKNNRGESI